MSWIDDYKASVNPAYFDYVAGARSDFLASQIAMSKTVTMLYDDYARDILKAIGKGKASQFTTGQVKMIQSYLEKSSSETAQYLAESLKKAISDNIANGVNVSRLVSEKIGFPGIININAFYSMVNEEAIASYLAKKKLLLSNAVWTLEPFKKAIYKTVAASIATGTDALKTAKLLSPYLRGKGSAQRPLIRHLKNGKIKKYYVPRDVRYESLRLVRTETSQAFMNGVYAGANSSPFYLGIRWILSATHIITDVCDDYASIGFFKKGDEPFLPHPNCMCVQNPVYEDPEVASKKLNEWVKSPSSHPEIEGWYNGYYKKVMRIPASVPKVVPKEAPVSVPKEAPKKVPEPISEPESGYSVYVLPDKSKYTTPSYSKMLTHGYADAPTRIKHFYSDLGIKISEKDAQAFGKAMDSWTSTGYKFIREAQLGLQKDELYKRYADTLERFIKEGPTVKPGTSVYRVFGLDKKEAEDLFANIKKMKEYSPGQGAMFSTSLSRKEALEDFGYLYPVRNLKVNVVVKIETKDITKSVYLAASDHPSELELLFSSNSKFLVKSVRYSKAKGVLSISLEEVKVP